ncbi:MAG: bifunctional DNA-formamidopyrimidine glycosylase/DNA-(apurinic or apyrimidinic site) lyase [Gammaproteobacteria bacterium]|nr:bifunctional DNA-formamidopyrimidine glycosylase/DNA-(apurinic or apyrimidinic site) lyase [Gammaproteobacteria bacterium]MYA67578.1 bifunctional DNA-formamidopyrimidine glycosylase/DNA-(apurinic or apyrimidinic site) lyase [Gammaproteobacteria bacterium]MYE29068.1 bifunctional DNA-formamidopyrimidine glycosylase/DNA-(apurinic or apyrimidinic site) lyase [Gammaproteobacteria bacterium]MYH46699.1 bifunctional DNA-formamidopyrimidine glycosylase/DNA-(apurinic or apyrimidinic site) lyase [Gammap
MPELPEVETTRLGVAPCVIDRQIIRVDVREPRLRWPVPKVLVQKLPGQRFTSIGRRAKYLLFHCEAGILLIHLGMSGSLRLAPAEEPAAKHAHVDIVFDSGRVLRFTDPRKFGSMHWQPAGAGEHPLLQGLGPEPLGDEFNGTLLHSKSRGRRAAVKNLIMDSRTVAGIGNIYACEALFLAGIHPARACGRISVRRYEKLAETIRLVLAEAIRSGGTSLRDFTGGDGRPGYFKQQLNVYGRGGENCLLCSAVLREIRLGQRSTVFCPSCQT